VLIGLALLPGFHLHVTTDGISYLSIAQDYADGRFGDAVSGYWSPLMSWLLVPTIAVGVPGPLAFKLTNLAVAAGVLWGVRRLSRTLGAGPGSIEVVSWALAFPLVAAAYAFATPDLLVVLPVLLYLEAVCRWGDDGWRAGLAAGAWAGLAYLAKLFALPFILVHLPLAAALLAWRKGARQVLAAAGVALATAGLVVGAWTAVLSTTYGRATPGTAAEVNFEFMAPDSPGATPLWIGLLPPPHEEAVSSWQDLPRSLELAEQAGSDVSGGIDDPAGDAATVGSGRDRIDPVGTLRRGVGQLPALGGELLGWTPVLLLAIGLPAAVRLRPARKVRRHPAVEDLTGTWLVAAGAVIWVGGVALTYPQTRYLWGALLPVAAIAALTLDVWRAARPRDARREAAAAVLVLAMLPWAGNELAREWRASEGIVALAEALDESTVDVGGKRVASLSHWVRTTGLCYFADCTYYGTPRSPITPEELQTSFARYEIEYVITYQTPPADLGLGEPVTTIDRGRVEVYDVR
jgi:hypothetical protein